MAHQGIMSSEQDNELAGATANADQTLPIGMGAVEPHGDGVIGPSDVEIESPPPYTVFSKTSKRIIVLLCAVAGFFSPFSAFTYFPALEYMAADLGVSLQLMNLTITVYLVIQGVIPAVLGDLADQIGRRPVYLLVLVVYVAACIGLALQRLYAALVVLRMLQSAGSSGQSSIPVSD